jgi:uncharacterized protein YuzE
MTKLNFGLSIDTDNASGEVVAVYFQIRKGRSHETREFADGAAFADYNANGELIGIELLAPCRVSIVDQLAANEPLEVRRKTKRFLRESGPRRMIAV